jgi:hypothetical protein
VSDEQPDPQHDVGKESSDRHILPLGNRRDDPPPKHWRWRVGLTVAKYPVQVAILLALIILALPLAMLVSANSDLRASQTALRNSQIALRTALVQSSTSRKATSSAVCQAVNKNAHANNGQTKYLKSIIIQSVKDSHQFEATYRQLGLPSYAQRMRQAKVIARKLDRFDVKDLNCEELARKIERDVQAATRRK